MTPWGGKKRLEMKISGPTNPTKGGVPIERLDIARGSPPGGQYALPLTAKHVHKATSVANFFKRGVPSLKGLVDRLPVLGSRSSSAGALHMVASGSLFSLGYRRRSVSLEQLQLEIEHHEREIELHEAAIRDRNELMQLHKSPKLSKMFHDPAARKSHVDESPGARSLRKTRSLESRGALENNRNASMRSATGQAVNMSTTNFNFGFPASHQTIPSNNNKMDDDVLAKMLKGITEAVGQGRSHQATSEVEAKPGMMNEKQNEATPYVPQPSTHPADGKGKMRAVEDPHYHPADWKSRGGQPAPSIFSGPETQFHKLHRQHEVRHLMRHRHSKASPSVQVSGEPFVPLYSNAISGLRQHPNVMEFAEKPKQPGSSQHSNVTKPNEELQPAMLGKYSSVTDFAKRPEHTALAHHSTIMDFAERPKRATLSQHSNVMDFVERPHRYTASPSSKRDGMFIASSPRSAMQSPCDEDGSNAEKDYNFSILTLNRASDADMPKQDSSTPGPATGSPLQRSTRKGKENEPRGVLNDFWSTDEADDERSNNQGRENTQSMRDISFRSLLVERGDSPELPPVPRLAKSPAERLRMMNQVKRRNASDSKADPLYPPYAGPSSLLSTASPSHRVKWADDVKFKAGEGPMTPAKGSVRYPVNIGRAITTDDHAETDTLNETTPPRSEAENLAIYLRWRRMHGDDDSNDADDDNDDSDDNDNGTTS